MSKSLGEMYAELAIKTDKLSDGSKRSEAILRKLNADIDHITDNINAKLESMGKTLTIGVTAPLTLLGYQAGKTFASFEQAMQNTFSVMSASTAEMELLRSTAEKMGAETRFSASQAADALYSLGSAGQNAQTAVKTLDGVLKLAGATQSDLASTSATLASTISQFKLEASDSGRVADVFAKAISKSQATMGKLAYSMRYAGPIAAGFGMSLEETTAALMALYNAGYQGEQAGTIMRGGLTMLAKQTTSLDEALKAIHLTYKDVNPATNSFAEILQKLQNAGASTTDVIKIFGSEAGAGMASLVSQGADVVVQFDKVLQSAEGAAAEMQKIQNASMANSIKEMQSAWEAVQITITSNVSPAIDLVFGSITKTLRAIEALPPGFQVAGTSALVFAAAAGPILLVAVNVQKLKKEMVALNLVMKSNPVMIWGTAAAATISILSGIIAQVQAAKKEQEALVERSKQLAIEENRNLEETIKTYQKLSEKKKLSYAEDKKLQEAVSKLKAAFPELTAQYDANTNAMKLNNEEVKKAIQNRTLEKKMALQNAKYNLEQRISDNEAELALLEKERDNLEKQRTENLKRNAGQAIALNNLLAPDIAKNKNSISSIEDALRKAKGQLGLFNEQLTGTDAILDALGTTAKETGSNLGSINAQSQGQRLAELDAEWEAQIKLIKERGGDSNTALRQWGEARVALIETFIKEDAVAGKAWGESWHSGFAKATIGSAQVVFGSMEQEYQKSLDKIKASGDGILDALYDISKIEGVSLDKMLGDPAKVIASSDQIIEAIDAAQKKLNELKSKGGTSEEVNKDIAKYEELIAKLKEAFSLTGAGLFLSLQSQQEKFRRELDATREQLITIQGMAADAIQNADANTALILSEVIKVLNAKVTSLESQLGIVKEEDRVRSALEYAKSTGNLKENIRLTKELVKNLEDQNLNLTEENETRKKNNIEIKKAKEEMAKSIISAVDNANNYVGATNNVASAIKKGVEEGLDANDIAAVADDAGMLIGGIFKESIGSELGKSIGGLVGSFVGLFSTIFSKKKKNREELSSYFEDTIKDAIKESEDNLKQEYYNVGKSLGEYINSGIGDGLIPSNKDMVEEFTKYIFDMISTALITASGFEEEIAKIAEDLWANLSPGSLQAKKIRDEVSSLVDSIETKFKITIDDAEATDLASDMKEYGKAYWEAVSLGLRATFKYPTQAEKERMKYLSEYMNKIITDNETLSKFTDDQLQELVKSLNDPNYIKVLDRIVELEAEFKTIDTSVTGSLDQNALDDASAKIEEYNTLIQELSNSLGLASDDTKELSKSISDSLTEALGEAAFDADWSSFKNSFVEQMKKAIISAAIEKYGIAEKVKAIIDAAGVDEITQNDITASIDSLRTIYDDFEASMAPISEIIKGLTDTEIEAKTSGTIIQELSGSDRDYLAEVITSAMSSVSQNLDFTNAAIQTIQATQLIINSLTYNHEGNIYIQATDETDLKGLLGELITQAMGSK